MDLTKLFDLSYLFQRYILEGFSWPTRIALLVIILILIILAIVAQKKMKIGGFMKKVWRKIQVWGWTTAILGLLLFIFREVRALYLGSRGLLLIWGLLVVVWLIMIIWFRYSKIPNSEDQARKKAEYDKWLPKQK